ncbi:MAG TPA: hypothetical protein VFG45_04565 [Candidatus Nitrosocosmicus sp.]|nr:hypothetical protein [Candidatus Nitrosocosmicus sp.]
MRDLYEAKDIRSENEIITYCRIGERSSHTWFVLKYLLGYPMLKITMTHGPNGET